MRQGLASATIFSLTAEQPTRQPAVPAGPHPFDAATLIVGERRAACAIRKLTAAGATLGCADAISGDDPLALELTYGQTLPGRVSWTAEGELGFVFDTPIDVVGTLARRLATQPSERRQMPRVELQQVVNISAGARSQFARARNISQGGMGVATSLPLAPDTPVRITVDGLRPLCGTARWCHDGQAGIGFDEELPWQVLMPWLRQVQQTPVQAARGATMHEPEGMIPDKHAIRVDTPARVREGVHWWNVKLRGLTAHLVEFESAARFLPGAQLWVALPQIGGAPASVIERRDHRFLCEFRLPLQERALGMLTGR